MADTVDSKSTAARRAFAVILITNPYLDASKLAIGDIALPWGCSHGLDRFNRIASLRGSLK